MVNMTKKMSFTLDVSELVRGGKEITVPLLSIRYTIWVGSTIGKNLCRKILNLLRIIIVLTC